MKPVPVIAACGVLFLGSLLILGNSPNHFVGFGTLFEPDAFYGSGNLYLSMDASIAWSMLALSIAITLGVFTAGSTRLDPDRLLNNAGRWFPWIVCGLIFVAAQMSSWLVFEHHPRDVDHVARIFQAKTFASGQLAVAAPPLPEFFSVFAVLVNDGEFFSKYAPGGALFFMLPELLFGTSAFINPLLGAAGAGFFYLAFLNWFDERTARLTLLFAALSPWFVFTIASFHSHVPAMALFSVTLYLFSRVTEEKGYCRELVLAGFTGGLFVMTREYTSLLICLPLVVSMLISKPELMVQRIAALSTGVIVPVCLLLGYNHRLTGDPFLFPHLLADPEQVPWFGYKGHTVDKAFIHLFEAFRLMNINLLGWPLSLCLLPFAVLYRSSKLLVLFVCLLCLMAGYFANYWTDYSLGVRYYFEATPILFLLSAAGFWQIYDRLGHSLVFNRAMLFWLVLVLYGFSATVYVPKILTLYKNQYNGNVYTRVADFARELPEQASLVFCVGAGGENDGYASGFLANPLNLAELSKDALDGKASSGGPIFARDLGGRNQELMALFPGRTYYRYRYDPQKDAGVFIPLDQLGNEVGTRINVAKES